MINHIQILKQIQMKNNLIQSIKLLSKIKQTIIYQLAFYLAKGGKGLCHQGHCPGTEIFFIW